MAVLFVEGFDKYGPVGQTTPAVTSLLTAGEWLSVVGSGSVAIGAPLSASGQSFQITSALAGATLLAKTLTSNYARLICGFRFSATNFNGGTYLALRDGTTYQTTLTINPAGTISLRTGNQTGTILATGGSITGSSIHYFEFDITIGAAGAYQVWLDGTSLFSGTGNTRGGGVNNYANQILLGDAGNVTGAIEQWDDLYLFDSSGTTNNAVLLNNPIVETSFPNADSAKAWTNNASIIGVNNSSFGSPASLSANTMRLRTFAAPANMTLNSISVVPAGSSGTVNLRPVVYAGNTTGAALLATGPTVTGATSGTTLTLPLTSPLVLTGGTNYTFGVMGDASINMQLADASTTGITCTATFSSGAPATLPTVTPASSSVQCWGNCTGSAADYVNLNMNPAADDTAYLSSSTVGQQEMQGFPVLASTPSAVACVAYKARIKRSDAGNRNVEVHCVSGAADSAGSTAGGVTPGSSYAWIGGYFPLDPQSGAAWTGSGVNGASGGVKVVS